MILADYRREYHRRVFQEIVRISRDSKKGIDYPNFADNGSKASIRIAWELVKELGHETGSEPIKGQTSGGRFEEITRDFLQNVFDRLQHVRPGSWRYSTRQPISKFDQYAHLAYLEKMVKENKELASSLGKDYIIHPDIVVGRELLSDEEINKFDPLIGNGDQIAQFTSLRRVNSVYQYPLLHASISCKWTIRSDRSQNTRTESLNLIRNRKGHLPHIVAVTAEPLPTRIAALALGTGDLDCVYHFALPELTAAIAKIDNEDQMDMITMLIEGSRLRDIGDLPLDLAV